MQQATWMERPAARILWLLVLVPIVGLAGASLGRRSLRDSPALNKDQAERMTVCRNAILQKFSPPQTDLQTLGSVHGLCYTQIKDEDTLGEFNIRRTAFVEQQGETGVLLWMVVAITISGVILAGFQLWGGYRLSLVGKGSMDGGGTVDGRKVSISSSVTGVVILFISLLFFYVFVQQVYLIKDAAEPPPYSAAGGPNTNVGWTPSSQLLANAALESAKNSTQTDTDGKAGFGVNDIGSLHVAPIEKHKDPGILQRPLGVSPHKSGPSK